MAMATVCLEPMTRSAGNRLSPSCGGMQAAPVRMLDRTLSMKVRLLPIIATAVDWARVNGVVNGMDENGFFPRNSATRAEVAAMLRNYLTFGEDND